MLNTGDFPAVLALVGFRGLMAYGSMKGIWKYNSDDALNHKWGKLRSLEILDYEPTSVGVTDENHEDMETWEVPDIETTELTNEPVADFDAEILGDILEEREEEEKREAERAKEESQRRREEKRLSAKRRLQQLSGLDEQFPWLKRFLEHGYVPWEA